MHQLKYTSELSKATIFWWYKSIRSSLTKPYENKKFGYKHPKTPHISLTMPYKFFGFATVPLSFGGATVFHQTKPFEFYIIFSLSLSLHLSLNFALDLNFAPDLEQTRGFWCQSGAMEELWVLSGVNLVLWRSCEGWSWRSQSELIWSKLVGFDADLVLWILSGVNLVLWRNCGFWCGFWMGLIVGFE